ncbi:MAG: MFS transporter [Lachnoclostridium sp.]|nr:MFS transporter [Lachnoclostridium sp.]
MNLKMLGTKFFHNKQVLGFCFYDFSNSAFILLINSYLFPIFLKTEVFGNEKIGDYYWGLAVSLSVLIALIISPIMGSLADRGARKIIMLVLVTMTFIGVVGLSTISPRHQFIMLGAYIFTNACYTMSLAIYDSILPHIAPPDKYTLVSSLSWGVGYLGGVICFLFVFFAQTFLSISNQSAFLLTGIFYAVFSILSLKNMPSSTINSKTKKTNISQIKNIFPFHIILFLIVMWLINEALDTIINFTSLFGFETLMLSTTTIGIMLLVVQVLAIPSTILFGKLAKKTSERFVILASIIVWLVICSLGLFATNTIVLLVIVILTSLVIGTTSSLLRSNYANRVSKEHSGLSFSLYSIATRSSSLVGPLLFGIISTATGSQRIAIISIMVPLFLGAVLFMFLTRENVLPF